MDKQFCENLRSARKECNCTQRQIAAQLGVVESCYANWEQGRTEPNLEMLRRLCAIFQLTADELLNGTL